MCRIELFEPPVEPSLSTEAERHRMVGQTDLPRGQTIDTPTNIGRWSMKWADVLSSRHPENRQKQYSHDRQDSGISTLNRRSGFHQEEKPASTAPRHRWKAERRRGGRVRLQHPRLV